MPWSIRQNAPADGPRVLEIWARAVDTTHDFLTQDDRTAIAAEVADFLPGAPLLLAVDEQDRPLAFMLVTGGHMDALFVDPEVRGQGVGRALVGHALRDAPHLTTDVNEQNSQAVGFYERMGFRRIGRTDHDGQGRPYPLLHLQKRGD